MRCRACGTIIFTETTKCQICGTRFVSRHEKIMGEEAILERARRHNKNRTMEDLVEAFNQSKKAGVAIHMEREDLVRLKAFQDDLKKDFTKAMTGLHEGKYD